MCAPLQNGVQLTVLFDLCYNLIFSPNKENTNYLKEVLHSLFLREEEIIFIIVF